jgi:hypothetical protein
MCDIEIIFLVRTLGDFFFFLKLDKYVNKDTGFKV